MILRKQENDAAYDPNIIIPAIFKDDKLIIGNNGISSVFFGPRPKECDKYSANEFHFYAMSNPPTERAFFVTWVEYCHRDERPEEIIDTIVGSATEYAELWEIFYVFSKRKIEPNGQVKKKELQYTCLRHCRPDTLFCKCDTCGEHFVLTPQTAKFYRDRNLALPINRCAKCIQKKRMRYASKNK